MRRPNSNQLAIVSKRKTGEQDEHNLGRVGLGDVRLQYLHIHLARLGFACPTASAARFASRNGC